MFFGIGAAIIGGLCAVISTVSSAVGAAVAGAATALVVGLPKLGLPEIVLMKLIEVIVSGIAELLGLKKEQETPEEIGAKARMAERSIDEFESTEKYIEYLRNEVKLDMDNYEKMSPEEKLACSAIGVSLYAKNIEEKTGVALSPEFLLKAGEMRMQADEVKAYMDGFKGSSISDMKEMSDFLTGRLDEKNDLRVESAIASGLKILNPEMSEKDIQIRLGDMREKALNPEIEK